MGEAEVLIAEIEEALTRAIPQLTSVYIRPESKR